MQKHDRQLQEIQHWCNANNAGLEILFSALVVTVIDSIPHPWQITIGRGRVEKEIYHAYGTSMRDAVDRCLERLGQGITGYMWKDVQRRNINLEEWFISQQEKTVE